MPKRKPYTTLHKGTPEKLSARKIYAEQFLIAMLKNKTPDSISYESGIEYVKASLNIAELFIEACEKYPYGYQDSTLIKWSA